MAKKATTDAGVPPATPAPRRSVIYSVLVLSGIGLLVGGAVVAVLGLGKPAATSISIGGDTISTSSVGLAIAFLGATVAVTSAVKKPADVQLFAENAARPRSQSLLDLVPIAGLLLLAITGVLLVVSLVTS